MAKTKKKLLPEIEEGKERSIKENDKKKINKAPQLTSWLMLASVWPGFEGCKFGSQYQGLAFLAALLTENMT